MRDVNCIFGRLKGVIWNEWMVGCLDVCLFVMLYECLCLERYPLREG